MHFCLGLALAASLTGESGGQRTGDQLWTGDGSVHILKVNGNLQPRNAKFSMLDASYQSFLLFSHHFLSPHKSPSRRSFLFSHLLFLGRLSCLSSFHFTLTQLPEIWPWITKTSLERLENVGRRLPRAWTLVLYWHGMTYQREANKEHQRKY